MSGVGLYLHLGLPRPTSQDIIMDELRNGGLMTVDLLRGTTSIHMAELRHTLAEMKADGQVLSVVGADGVERWALVRS